MIDCLALFAFGLTLLVTPAFSRFLLTRNLTDQPDGTRKLHTRAVPRLGGVAVFSAFLLAMLAASVISVVFGRGIQPTHLLRIAPALSIIFLVGLADDLTSLPAGQKLAFQTWASIIAVAMGVRFGSNANASFEAVLLESFLTVAWLVLCTNAFNLIDGMDGLAAGLAFILALTMAFGGAHNNQTELLLVDLVLAGALLGFLRFNFCPASIFLGDSGSLSIGFLLSCLAVLWSNQQTTFPAKIAPAVAFAVPLADVSLSIVRRLLAGRSIFSPDRDHIHHRLLRNGFTVQRSALALYAAASFASLVALACVLAPPAVGLCLLGVLVCVAIWCFRQLKYVEFQALATVTCTFSIPRAMTSHIVLGRFHEAIKATADPLRFWIAIKQACLDFGFEHVRLTWGGRIYEDNLPPSPREGRTSLFFSVNGEDSLVVSGKFSPHQHRPAFGAFVATVLEELQTRNLGLVQPAQRTVERSAPANPSVATRQAS